MQQLCAIWFQVRFARLIWDFPIDLSKTHTHTLNMIVINLRIMIIDDKGCPAYYSYFILAWASKRCCRIEKRIEQTYFRIRHQINKKDLFWSWISICWSLLGCFVDPEIYIWSSSSSFVPIILHTHHYCHHGHYWNHCHHSCHHCYQS